MDGRPRLCDQVLTPFGTASLTLGCCPLSWIHPTLIWVFYVDSGARRIASGDYYRLLRMLTYGAAELRNESRGAARHFEAAISFIGEYMICV
eukprot:6210614-Pleurochrysis_carterae.AAC.2